jgi:peptidyl-prolyl cis-trans isomerase D
VTDITVPEVSADAENKRVTDNMRRTMSEDVLAQYVQRLQTDIGATINFDVVRRVASGSTDQN